MFQVLTKKILSSGDGQNPVLRGDRQDEVRGERGDCGEVIQKSKRCTQKLSETPTARRWGGPGPNPRSEIFAPRWPRKRDSLTARNKGGQSLNRTKRRQLPKAIRKQTKKNLALECKKQLLQEIRASIRKQENKQAWCIIRRGNQTLH